jgi:myotubularin-related protein 14
MIIENKSIGQVALCESYPLRIIVPTSGRNGNKGEVVEHAISHSFLKNAFENSKYARVHTRFVVPTILTPSGQFICRSSTLSCRAESVLQNSKNRLENAFLRTDHSPEHGMLEFEKQHDSDVSLISRLKVGYIFDLMVESHKKWKGISVTSSEKADPEKFEGISINSIPYPGCEFFRPYKLERNRSAVGHVYDWDLGFVNANLSVDSLISDLEGIDWKLYKRWDLIVLTNNYLRLIFESLSRSKEQGVLIHCISGWDRTPLFVSLVRICLWADGHAHESLNCEEFLYLTLAYDWLLFAHQLKDRLKKSEEILHFCFYFLQFVGEDVGLQTSRARSRERKARLASLWNMFEPIYKKIVDPAVENNEETEEGFLML